MSELGCDSFYQAFSFLNGFKVRLNPKLGRDEIVAAQYVGIVGNQLEDPEIVRLLAIHDSYIQHHKSPVSTNEYPTS